MKKTYTGINIQWPISREIISGKKIVETRTYPLPEKYLGKEMLLIETPGSAGKFKSRIVAIIKFTESFRYPSMRAFYADHLSHLVDKKSPWAWKDKPKWGWKIGSVKPISPPIDYPKPKGIIYTKDISLRKAEKRKGNFQLF